MKNNFLQEILIAVFLIVLLVLFVNPFDFWMPDMLVMMMVTVLAVLYFIFAGFVWKEKARDERESMHKMLASRVSFLSGSLVLVLGVIVQSMTHSLDIWLVYALSVMLVAKIAGHIYVKIKC